MTNRPQTPPADAPTPDRETDAKAAAEEAARAQAASPFCLHPHPTLDPTDVCTRCRKPTRDGAFVVPRVLVERLRKLVAETKQLPPKEIHKAILDVLRAAK